MFSGKLPKGVARLYPEPNHTTPHGIAPVLAKPRSRYISRANSGISKPTAQPGKVVSTAQHFSQLVYAVPRERAQALIPAALRSLQFELAESEDAGQPSGWLTVVSYLDQRSPVAGMPMEDSFELTEYRLHMRRNGMPYQWLFSTSVGSLMAVGTRHLWSLPWHLSAMELRLSFDEARLCYQNYRLQMQSEHVNALWELRDSGVPVSGLREAQLPHFVFSPLIQDCFIRPTGGIGTRQTRLRFQLCTHGTLAVGRCDFLTRQGWLLPHEVTRPHFVRLSRSVAFEQEAPVALLSAEAAAAQRYQSAA
jgi:hypothetical protein